MSESPSPPLAKAHLTAVLLDAANDGVGIPDVYCLTLLSCSSKFGPQSTHWTVAAISTLTPPDARIFNVCDGHRIGGGGSEWAVSVAHGTFEVQEYLGGVRLGYVHALDLDRLQEILCTEIPVPVDTVDRDCRVWTQAAIAALATLQGSFMLPLLENIACHEAPDLLLELCSKMNSTVRLSQAQDGIPVIVPFRRTGG